MEDPNNKLETELLHRIAKSSLDSIGTNFFRATVKGLSELLDLKGVMICEFIEPEQKLKAFAFWVNNDFVENYEYNIQGTPCEPAINSNSIYFIPDNLVDFFPRDNDIIKLNAASYIGLAIRDTDGGVIGHLAALNDKPLKNISEIKSVFEIIVSRATLEMLRLRAETKLKESEEQLKRLVNGTQDFIIEFNDKFQITQANEAAASQFFLSRNMSENISIKEIMTEEALQKVRLSVNQINNSNAEGARQYHHINEYLIFKTFDEKEIYTEATLSFYIHNKEKYYILICRNSNPRIEQENKINFLNQKSDILQEEIRELYGFGEIIGKSKAITDSFEMIKQVAPYDTTVIITGETGTGKELFARAIHQNSSRADKTILNINCAALPQNLIESELFGHEKGAFTGAMNKREGRFLLANNGTIFLDEIGELPLDLQSKLLRVIQEGEFQPVGSDRTVKVNVRLVAATNRDLAQEVKNGKFREDLYFRLNVFNISIPPLRERGNDIIILAQFFIDKFTKKLRKKSILLSEDDIQRLMSYHWPGNIRELQNLMERGVITSIEGSINISSLLPENSRKSHDKSAKEKNVNTNDILSTDSIKELEKGNIIKALEQCKWKISGPNGAATVLNIPASTLTSKIKAFSIKRKD